MDNTPEGRNGENIKNKTPKRLSEIDIKSYKLKLSAHARSNSKTLGTKYSVNVNIETLYLL